MIDGSVILFMLSVLLAFALSIETAIISRREHRHRPELITPPIARAYPIVSPSPSLEELVQQADAAIEADELARGVVGVARAYQSAARRRTSC